MLPLFVHKYLDNRPYIKINLLGIDISALFDSGANTSVVGRNGIEILSHLGIKICHAKNKRVTTADGSHQKVLGTVELPLVSNGHSLVISALVVPSLSHNFILGCDFAQKFGILVNFKDNSWFPQSLEVNSKINSNEHFAKCPFRKSFLAFIYPRRSIENNLVHRKGIHNVIPDALSRISNQAVDKCSFRTPSAGRIYTVDIDRIDPWYDNLRQKIRSSPENFPQWKVENDFVYKFIPNSLSLKVNVPEWKILVPKPQREEIIDKCHTPPTSGHFGFYKTLHRVQEQYYWPKMRFDILKFVRNCEVCGAQKSPNTLPMGLMGKEKIVNYPFQVIAADLVGPFPRSKKGNKWLFVVSCWFTKYTMLFPLKSSKGEYLERALENNVFLIHGVPSLLICDNGTQFTSKSFKSLSETYGFNIRFNPVYSPQCNFVERNNRTIGTAIRCYVNSHDNWDKEISKIQQAINTSKHEVTGFTPSFLVYGRHIPLSGLYYKNLNLDVSIDNEIIPGDRNAYAENLKGLKDIFTDVRNKIHRAYERNSKLYNLRKRNFSFKIGDHVWRKNKILSSAVDKFTSKLVPKYVHCVIREKISDLVYGLVTLNGTKVGYWHIKDLKPFNGPDPNESFSEEE